MNISKTEQRVLHTLAQGGHIVLIRSEDGRIEDLDCFDRDGHRLLDCAIATFASLKRKRLIESHNSGPYRISKHGRQAVRSQLDNR